MHAREAGKQDVQNHADAHDQSGVRAELGEGHGNDGLVVRDDALHVEGVVEQLTEGEQGTSLQVASTSREHEEADDGLHGAHNDILDSLALEGETHESKEAD